MKKFIILMFLLVVTSSCFSQKIFESYPTDDFEESLSEAFTTLSKNYHTEDILYITFVKDSVGTMVPDEFLGVSPVFFDSACLFVIYMERGNVEMYVSEEYIFIREQKINPTSN